MTSPLPLITTFSLLPIHGAGLREHAITGALTVSTQSRLSFSGIITGYSELFLSPLNDLRSSSKSAKEGNDNEFAFQRTIALPQGKPNIITFAYQDSRLVVGLEEGLVLVYNAESLFTPGQEQVQPAHTRQLQSSALQQIAANPGTEPNLVDRFAVVGNDFVQLFDSQLEPHGGWSASDPSTIPAAGASNQVSWLTRAHFLSRVFSCLVT